MSDRRQTRNKGKGKASLLETKDEEMDVSKLISGSGIVLDLNDDNNDEDSKVKLEEEDYEDYDDDDDDADSLDKWMEEDDHELVDDDEITYVLRSKMYSIN
jgi:hypothetical protein